MTAESPDKKKREFFPEDVELLTFVGGWDTYIGVDQVETLFYLVRTIQLDWLEVVTRYGRAILNRQFGLNSPRKGSVQDAATRLLDSYVRSRINHECPVEPYRSGLLTAEELEGIKRRIAADLARNSAAAEEKQQTNEAPILRTARRFGLDPHPAGHDDNEWLATCPRSGHWILINTLSNQFGCGYCRVKGGPAELGAFCAEVRSDSVC